jgi:hypothetical protein
MVGWGCPAPTKWSAADARGSNARLMIMARA